MVCPGREQRLLRSFQVAADNPVPLMIAFHQRLAGGQPPMSALAGAQQQLGDGEPAAMAAAAGSVSIGTSVAAPPAA